MDIEALKSIKLDILTVKQHTAVLLALNGMSLSEIAKEMKCSKQNVSGLIKSAQQRASKPQPAWHTDPAANNGVKAPRKARLYAVGQYECYRRADLSILTNREREILGLKLDGLTHREIADKLGLTSATSVGVILQRAREKLDGTFDREGYNRKERERRRKNPESVKESNKKQYFKNREKRIEAMREYNKQYYKEHRNEILEKQRANKNSKAI